MTRLVWVALAALAVTGCHAYHRGDPVHASRRSKHKQWITKWSDLSPGQLPRFGEDSVIALRASFPPSELDASGPFRIMLSFADDRFSTPWILLWDGKGYAVEDIKVKIVFSGNDIESIDVEQRGSSKHGPGRRPAHVLVHYVWEEAVEHNTRLATRVLYLAGAALLLLSTVIVASDVTVPLVSGASERAKAA